MNLLVFTEIAQKIFKSGGRERTSGEKAEKLLPLSEPRAAYLSLYFKKEVKK